MVRQIILDTDIGGDVDDAIALALAMRSPEIELLLVSTVFSDTLLRARIAHKLLGMDGLSSVPVAAGCNLPLLRRYTPGLDGHEGLGLLGGEHDGLPVAAGHAADHIIQCVMGAREPVTLVTIGPLTNIALALIKEPAIIGRVRELCVMGGYVYPAEVGGRVLGPRADYNLVADPEAAQLVLEAGWPITLVPIEVTTRVWFDDADRAALRAAGTPLAQVLSLQIDHWIAHLERELARPDATLPPAYAHAYLHDPLALAAAFNERFLTLTPLHIRVHMEDGVPRTLPDPLKPPNMRVATDVDAPAFRRFVLQRLTA